MAKPVHRRPSSPVAIVLSIWLAAMLMPSCGSSGDGGPTPPPPPPASKDGWTWMAGSPAAGQPGAFGVKGQASADNTPPGKYYLASWVDSGGRFWLFGGDSIGTPSPLQGSQNDLWKYDPVSTTWTWISGEDTISHPGIYGTRGVASPDNSPGAREWAASWSDGQGGLWLFGGHGLDAT